MGALKSKSGTDYYELNCNDPTEPPKTCTADDGAEKKDGDIWTNEDCTKTCECHAGEKTCKDIDCGTNMECQHDNGDHKCVCPLPFVMEDDRCVEDDPCLAEMLEGTGTQKIEKWYYDININDCHKFTYTGEGGNPNNYNSERMCLKECGRMPPECYEPGDSGKSCSGGDGKTIIKYFYNTEVNACKKLHYLGCGGNGNNFDERDYCQEYCKKPWNDED